MRLWHKSVLAVLLAGVFFTGAVVSLVPELNWRARVVISMAQGEIQGIEWSDLLRMLRPGSPHYLESLTLEKNIYSAVKNSFVSSDDIASGQELYRQNCVACHGVAGAISAHPDSAVCCGKYQA